MRFGEWYNLCISPSSSHFVGSDYLNYPLLKAAIEEIQQCRIGAQQQFLLKLNQELQRVDTKYKQVLNDLKQQYETPSHDETTSSSPPSTTSSKSSIISPSGYSSSDVSLILSSCSRADEYAQELVKVDHFGFLNALALKKILKKHDKNSTLPCSAHYQQHASRSNIWCAHTLLEPAYVALSKAYQQYREYERYVAQCNEKYARACAEAHDADSAGSDEGKDEEQGGSSFTRQSIKYWIKQKDLCAVICILTKHIPIFTMGDYTFSQYIESVYVDDAAKQWYERRLRKEQGSRLIRFRGYGGVTSPSQATIWCERKIHHEAWTQETSNKERFPLPFDKILPFIQGKYSANPAFRSKHPLFDEIQSALISEHLTPAVRTCCDRIAFQTPGDANFRMSLDINLKMIREHVNEISEWFTPANRLQEFDVHRCVLAVLEVKISLTKHQTLPAWYSELLNLGLLYAVPKFSKYCHGTATLFTDRIKTLPYWIPMYEEAAIQEERYSGADEVIAMGEGNLLAHSKGMNARQLPATIVPQLMDLVLDSQTETPAAHTPDALIAHKTEDTPKHEHNQTNNSSATISTAATPIKSSNVSPTTSHVTIHKSSPPPPLMRSWSNVTPVHDEEPISISTARQTNSPPPHPHQPFIRPFTPVLKSKSNDSYSMSAHQLSSPRDSHIINNMNTHQDTQNDQATCKCFPFSHCSPCHASPPPNGASSSTTTTTTTTAAPATLTRRFSTDSIGTSPAPASSAKLTLQNDVRNKLKSVDPKTYFANERTFLQYFHTAILLLTAGAALLGVDRTMQRTVGIVLMCVAIIIVMYALRIFHRRIYALQMKIDNGSFLAPVGPTFMAVTVLAAAVFAVIYAIIDGRTDSNTNQAD